MRSLFSNPEAAIEETLTKLDIDYIDMMLLHHPETVMGEGKVQFMESITLSAPYMVRVSIPDLNIRQGPGTSYPKTGKLTGVGIFTVVEEKDGWGLLKAYQEKRDGRISLAFTIRI